MEEKRLIGQKPKPLNNEIYCQQLRKQLRDRGIDPRIIDRQKREEYLSSGQRPTLNLEKQIEQAKVAARERTLELQAKFPSFEVDTERFNREFVARVEAIR